MLLTTMRQAMSGAQSIRLAGVPIARAKKFLRQETRSQPAKPQPRVRVFPAARKKLQSEKPSNKQRPAEWSVQTRWTCRPFSTTAPAECRRGQGRCRRSAAKAGDDIRSGSIAGSRGQRYAQRAGAPKT